MKKKTRLKAINPKTGPGAKKPSLGLIPGPALIDMAAVMELGAKKYGSYNWRDSPVPTMTYINAAMRHLLAYIDGENLDEESRESHLAHVMSCCAIVIDAQYQGTLDDDRPHHGCSARAIAEHVERRKDA